jgi:hypothetical protein
LRDIQPQVTTRKILLVGHSQGTFYTNAMYNYLLQYGAPEKTVAVYNLATPASYVAGGGIYLTSANDRLIIRVLQVDAEAGVRGPLPANILIPLPSSELKDDWGGHHFESDYLSGASDRIVSDISKALESLKSIKGTAQNGCFDAPPETLALKAEKLVFAVADPLANTTTNAAVGAGKAIAAATQKAYAAAATLAQTIGNALPNVTGKTQVNAASQGGAVALAVTPSPVVPKSAPAISPPAPVSAAVSPPPVPNPATAKTESPPSATLPPAPPPTVIPAPNLISVSPGFGAGGTVAPSEPEPTPVVFVPLSVASPSDAALYTSSSTTFTGTTTAGFVVAFAYGTNTASTTADTNGDWSAILTLPEGTTAVGIVASDADGNTSDAITRSITIDTTPPDAPAPSIAECSAAGSGYCEIATTTVNVSWSAVANSIYYALTKNAVIAATTTATTMQFVIDNNATTTFAVAAYDLAGNGATSADVSVFVQTLPPLPPLLIPLER